MSLFDGLRHRFYVLRRGEAYADEIRREMQFHRELDTLAASGNSLGNETYYREEVRAMTPQLVIDRLRQDAGYALRGVRREPGFALAVIFTLALGVGVNGTMFSLLDRIFLQPPAAVQRPDEVRRIYFNFGNGRGATAPRITSTYGSYPWFRAADRAVDTSAGLFGYTWPDSVLVRDQNSRISAMRSLVTPRYFRTLGVRPQRGRFFVGEEDQIGAPTPVAVISDAFWARAYDRRPDVLGRRVKIGAATYSIIGIAEPGFAGIDLDAVDIWAPANNDGDDYHGPGPWYASYASGYHMVARPRSASAESRVLFDAQNAVRATHVEHSIDDPTLRAVAGPIVRAAGPAETDREVVIATRVAGVSLVLLLIVVANVMNLLLLRAMRRQREFAVRQALGVSHGRLLQQVVVESLLLAMAGAAAAVAFSAWATVALRHFFFPESHWAGRTLDTRLLAFVFGVSALIGIGAGIAPALRAFSRDVADSLKAGTRRGAYRSSRVQSTLLAMQVALCVVLTVGAGLFVRSLDTVRSIRTGYDGRNQFFANPVFDEPEAHRSEVPGGLAVIAERLRHIDGVEAVSTSSAIPLYSFSFEDIYIGGRDSTFAPKGSQFPTLIAASPGFFAATGLPILSGRDFGSTDVKDAPPVAIVSAQMARLFWPGESAIGKCVYFGSRTAPCASIVGVVGDARRMRLIEAPGPQVYTSVMQDAHFSAHVLAVRTRLGRTAAIIHESDKIARETFSGMADLRVRTFDSIVEPELRPWRLGATLFSALGILALVVAAVGVYAVIAYGASQRTQEMGIRLALGAQPRDVVDLILRGGILVVGIGTAIGIIASLALGRTVASLLFGVVPADPSVLIGATVILVCVGGIASVLPGLRASRIDPMTALRAE